jgi:predicted methyltransferase
MIPDALVHIALDMSDACWQKLKTTDNAPPRVMINGLRFVLTSDLRAWLERQEKTMTVKERRGRRK